MMLDSFERHSSAEYTNYQTFLINAPPQISCPWLFTKKNEKNPCYAINVLIVITAMSNVPQKWYMSKLKAIL